MSKRTRGTNTSTKEPVASSSSSASAPRPSRSRAAASSSATAPAAAAQTSATNERKRARSSSAAESRKRAKPVKAEEKSDSDSASDDEDAAPAPAARRRQPASRPAAAAAAPAPVAPAANGGDDGVDNDAPASGDSSALRSWALQHLPGSSRKSPWPGHDDLAVDDKTYAYLSVVGVVPMTFGVKLPQSAAQVLDRHGYATPMAYGLAKSGWVGFKPSIDDMPTMRQIKKWVLESYHAQAKKTRIKQLEAAMRQ